MDRMMELLLGHDLPEIPEKEFEVKRLSKAYGERFSVRLRGLGYDRVAEIKERMEGKSSSDADCHILMEAMISPAIKNRELLDKVRAATPIDGIKAIFLPGEIEALSRQVEILSGYRGNNIAAIKKN